MSFNCFQVFKVLKLIQSVNEKSHSDILQQGNVFFHFSLLEVPFWGKIK